MNVYMPKIGLSMQEGTIDRWLVTEGKPVKKGEGIVDISSEKLTNTVEADADGVIEKILYQVGDVIACGEVIAVMNEGTAGQANTVHAVQVVPATPATPEKQPGGDPWRKVSNRMPLGAARTIIAERMANSLARSPQASLTTRADVSKVLDVRQYFAAQGIKLSYTDIFTKIIALALKENPLLNASLQNGEVIFYESINIGVAMAVDNNLLVPVVKNCQQKSLLQISEGIANLSRKAKENSLASDDMAGGTFTFSNLGMLDVDVMIPILNPPEAAILAIGSIRREAIIDEQGAVAVRPLATLSLTIDHAVMDGYPAGKFLESVKKWIAGADEIE